MKVDSGLMEIPSAIANGNSVKELVLTRLLNDKVITSPQYKEYMDEWQIIVFKRSWYKRWWDRFHKGSEDTYAFKFVKFQ